MVGEQPRGEATQLRWTGGLPPTIRVRETRGSTASASGSSSSSRRAYASASDRRGERQFWVDSPASNSGGPGSDALAAPSEVPGRYARNVPRSITSLWFPTI